MASPNGVEPGSWQQTTRHPACSNHPARAVACEDFPDPSTPSSTMNFPDFMQFLQHVGASPRDYPDYKSFFELHNLNYTRSYSVAVRTNGIVYEPFRGSMKTFFQRAVRGIPFEIIAVFDVCVPRSATQS